MVYSLSKLPCWLIIGVRLRNVLILFSKLSSWCWCHFVVVYSACLVEDNGYIACSSQGLYSSSCHYKNQPTKQNQTKNIEQTKIQNQSKRNKTPKLKGFYLQLHGERYWTSLLPKILTYSGNITRNLR